MSESTRARCPISSLRLPKSGISARRCLTPRRTRSAAAASRAHRAGDGAREQDREQHGDAGGDQEHAHDRHALGLHDGVDVAGFGGEQQAAEDGAVALHRDGHGDDEAAVLADAHDARRLAVQRRGDLGIFAPVGRADLLVDRQLAAPVPELHRVPPALDEVLLLAERRQVEALDEAAHVEAARIEEQRAVGIVDARARARRRDQPPEQRRDALRVDGKVGRALADR